MSDGEKERAAEAAKLREEIERLPRERGRAPRSPLHFVEEQMRKRAAEAEKRKSDKEFPSDSSG